VKFTTSTSVPVPARELASLQSGDKATVGLLAALFWCGDRRIDGRWLTADARESFGLASDRLLCVTREDMCGAMRGQAWLKPLREHIEACWRPFLQAFLDDVMIGRDALREELRRWHEEGTLGERLSGLEVPHAEHRTSIRKVLKRYGESMAGHIFQDLFAYLLAHAGYRKVIINSIGVPDIQLSEPNVLQGSDASVDIGSVTLEEALRLIEHCKAAGDLGLAARLEERVRGR